MSRWRAVAIKRFRDLREKIEKSSTLMELWIEFSSHFRDAYRQPRNESLILRVYQFADWCMHAPRVKDSNRDPITAVAISFFERLPVDKATREDMPRWFTYEDVAESRKIFSNLIGEESFAELLKHMAQNRHRFQPGWRLAK